MSARGVFRNGPPEAVRTRRLDFAVLAGAQALVNGVVFAIHGEQLDIGLAGGGHHYFSGRYQDFFI